MKNSSRILKNVLVALIVLFTVGFLIAANLLGDLWWFQSLGLESVFFTVLSSRIGLFLGLSAVFFGVFILMYLLAKKTLLTKPISKKFLGFYGLIGLFFGYVFSSQWLTVLKYLNATPFNVTEPVFSMDISYYVFELPFYFFLWNFFLTALIVAFGFLLLMKLSQLKPTTYQVEVEGEVVEHGGIDFSKEVKKIKKAKTFFSVSGALFFFLIALMFYLQRFNLLFSIRGAVFGAGFVDLNVMLPVLNTATVLAAIASIVFLSTTMLPKPKYAFIPVALLLIVLVFGFVAGAIIQTIQVEPDELNIEKPFIKRNIEFTNQAYGLNEIKERDFQISYELNSEDLQKNREVLDNVRVWDWRPLKQTFSELQLFRTYYSFEDVDIDRYDINGIRRQLMLSAREISIQDLPGEAQTWVNQHLVYTHGYGAVSIPVNTVSEEGLPEFFVKDIPPKAKFENLKIERPELYYGEKTHQFIVTNTETREFDYPKGEENVYSKYQGNGGILLDSSLKRIVYAIKFSSIPLLTSASITNESKILFRRQIQQRLKSLTPFLEFDSDPYLVIANGKLYWIVDGYTLTNSYPYSKPVQNFNYIRNSVKVVVDAFNGSIEYYVMEDDPLLKTYRKIFPDVFKDFEEMPPELKKHIRYPSDLFQVQASIFADYHMTDPSVFYNKEDSWVVPNESYHGRRQKMEPYYIITKVAQGEEEGFMLIMPFVPKGKNNMIGWMAAKCDPQEYGQKIIFKFSKQELAYGPMQIESRIDQDPQISQAFTLWGQQGSGIVRGNLLVIPVEDSVLYIEPVYLQATGPGSIPELKRVIVAYNDFVVMENTLGKALEKIFGKVSKPEKPTVETPTQTQRELIEKANSLYQEAQQALKDGNFSLYGKKTEELGEVLKRLGETSESQ